MNRMYQESIYEGYLTKSPPRMNRKWQRRYFVLLPHQKLIYFSKYNGEQKGIIDLDRVQEILFDLYLDKGPSNVISLEVKGQQDYPSRARGAPDRIYYLLADSREEMEVWHKHLMEVADLQLCRKNNVVADSTQGDEYYISARRRTAIAKEGADKRGLASSFNQDTAMAPEYGTYNRTVAELSQSSQVVESYGLYSSSNSQNLTDISISVGEESSSGDEEFTRPDSATKSTKSIAPKYTVKKHISLIPSVSLPHEDRCPSFSPPSPLPKENTCPSIPARRQEQMFPEELTFDLPLPPPRVSSLKRFLPPRHSAPSPGYDRPVARERKSMLSRSTKSEESDILSPPHKRPAAKMPSIPVHVLLTTIKEVHPSPTPAPRPRRPSSCCDVILPSTPTSPVPIIPYKTVKRGSEIFPDQDPIYSNDQPDHGYINVDPKDGTYVKFDPAPSQEAEGTYVSVSREPMDVKKLSTSTDPSGYTKIMEPKPRSKMVLPGDAGDNRNACKSKQ